MSMQQTADEVVDVSDQNDPDETAWRLATRETPLSREEFDLIVKSLSNLQGSDLSGFFEEGRKVNSKEYTDAVARMHILLGIGPTRVNFLRELLDLLRSFGLSKKAGQG